MAEKTLSVRIRGDASGVLTALGRTEKQVDAVGRRLERFGRSLTTSVSIPIAAVAAAATRVAGDFDTAFQAIRAGTGATGERLAELEAGFLDVFKTVPGRAADVAGAFADLATRTGATGERLETLTRQVVRLGRITGGGLPDLVRSTSRVFGDWSIATERQSAALDELFRASQQTGASVEGISEKVVQFGAPLRQMGFSFEQAIALVGKFEQEGVNLETVLSSLRVGLSTLARQGVNDPARAFQELTERIRAAGSAGDATRIAIEAFGSRAGPDMAAAIREGRFELGELVDKLRAADDSILEVAKETETFSERMQTLGNRVLAAAKPLGDSFADTLERLQPTFERMIDLVAAFAKGFAGLPRPLQTLVVAFGAIAASIGPVTFAAGQLTRAFAAIVGVTKALAGAQALGALAALLTPGGAILAGLAALAGVAYLVQNRTDKAAQYVQELREQVDKLRDSLGGLSEAQLQQVLASFGGKLSNVTIQIAEARAEVDRLEALRNQQPAPRVGFGGLTINPPQRQVEFDLAGARQTLTRLEAQRDAIIQSQHAVADALKVVGEAAAGTGTQLETITPPVEGAIAAFEELTDAQRRIAKGFGPQGVAGGLEQAEEAFARWGERGRQVMDLVALRSADVAKGVEELQKRLTAAAAELQDRLTGLQARLQQLQATGRAMAEGVGSAFEGFVTGAANLADSVKLAVDRILQELLRLSIQDTIVDPLSNLFAGFLGADRVKGEIAGVQAEQAALTAAAAALSGAGAVLTGSGAALAGAAAALVAAASALGAAQFANAANGVAGGVINFALRGGFIPGFAEGGRIGRGSLALVGERGPELFMPSSDGNIVPARETAELLRAGGGTQREVHQTVNINLQALDGADAKRMILRNSGTIAYIVRKAAREGVID